MASLMYNATWLAGALVAIAAASFWLSRSRLLRDLRRQHAEEALEALASYSEWVATQRRLGAFGVDRAGPVAALARLRQVQEAVFPELAPGLVRLLELHARLLEFLWRQQALRMRDPEAWLESDHDGRFMALWREHREAVHALAGQLRSRAGALVVDAQPESVFPA